MSLPNAPVFDISGGVAGSAAIPLVFNTPGANTQILWTYDGSDPTTGTIWQPGQVVPYNSWDYVNATSAAAQVFVQAIAHDTVQDTYSTIVIQEYDFTCANPVVVQTTTVDVSCSSPGSLLYYYAGTASEFSTLSPTAVQISNPSSLSLGAGSYVFFATSADSIVYNQTVVTTVVSVVGTVATPVLMAFGSNNNVRISAAVSSPGAVLHYTVDGTTPTAVSPVMPSSIAAVRGTVVSVVAIVGTDQSSIVSTTVKSPGEYILSGLQLPGSPLYSNGPSVPLSLRVRSFTVPC